VFSPLAIHAQVIKKNRKNRIVKVDERLIIGTEPQLKRALADSSNSEKINTSLVIETYAILEKSTNILNLELVNAAVSAISEALAAYIQAKPDHVRDEYYRQTIW
jgi:hypothetical protein